MKFLFINPPWYEDSSLSKQYKMQDFMPPLGLLYLATPLEKKGHEVELKDYLVEKFNKEELSKELEKIDAVCVTVTSYLIKSASKVVDIIKKFNPKIPVIIGGPHCTIQGKHTLNEINADICVRGEGERVILDIADALDGKKELSKINGIFYREADQIKNGLPVEIIEDINSIDFPARHLINKYDYEKKSITGITSFFKGNFTSMITTRGCPYNCRFCVVKSIFEDYRIRSFENVIEELVMISKEYDTVFIIDDNFLAGIKRAHKIMDYLIEKKLGLNIWIGGVRVNNVDEELFKKMRKAGVKGIEFGIESGNEEILEFYNKKITLDQIKKAVKLSKKNGFLTNGYFITGAPIETKDHIKDTIKFAKKLNLDFAFFYRFNYLKGSQIWKEAFELGKIKEHEMAVPGNSNRQLGNFTVEEIKKIINKANRSYYFRPRYLISEFYRQLFVFKSFKIFKADLKMLFHRK